MLATSPDLGRNVGVFAGACGAAVLAGAAVVLGGPLVLLAAVGAAGLALVALSGYAAPVLIVGLSAASIDALPGPSLSAKTLMMPTLALVLGVLALRQPSRPSRITTGVLYVSLTLACVVLFGLARAATLDGASAYETFTNGVDLLSLAALVPLYAIVLQDDTLRRRVIVGWGLLAAAVAAAYCAAALGFVPIEFSFIHGYRGVESDGITRVFSLSGQLPTAVLPFAFAAALLARTHKARLYGLLLALLCASATVLSLGRARYVAVGLACAAIVVLWGVRPRISRRVLVLVLAVPVVWVALASWSVTQPATSSVSGRFDSIFQTSAQRARADGLDTLGSRTRTMQLVREGLTPGEWIVGKGLIAPDAYWYPVDPYGLLRDPDLGWYGGLTTLGLLGVGLIFFYPLSALRAGWQRRKRDTADAWIIAGGLGFSVYVLASVQSLGLPFMPWGIAMSGAAFGLMFAVCQKTQPQRA